MRKSFCWLMVLVLLLTGWGTAAAANDRAISSFAELMPSNESNPIPIDQEVAVQFKKAVKLANGQTLTSRKAEGIAELRVGKNGGKLEAEVKWSPSKKKLTVKPKKPLLHDTVYTIRLLPGTVKDTSGRLNQLIEATFRTEPREPDYAITSTPAHRSRDVSVHADVILHVNKPIRQLNGTAPTSKSIESLVKLVDEDKKTVKFTGKWDEAKRVITIDPDGNLRDGMRYTVMLVEQRIKDRQGNKNPAFSFEFTTAKRKDIIPPSVTVTPPHGAKGVALGAHVTLQFGEEVKALTGEKLDSKAIAGMAVLKQENGTLVPYSATWNSRTRTITVRPKGKLSAYTSYTVTLPAKVVQDEAGNQNRSVQSTFVTGGK